MESEPFPKESSDAFYISVEEAAALMKMARKEPSKKSVSDLAFFSKKRRVKKMSL